MTRDTSPDTPEVDPNVEAWLDRTYAIVKVPTGNPRYPLGDRPYWKILARDEDGAFSCLVAEVYEREELRLFSRADAPALTGVSGPPEIRKARPNCRCEDCSPPVSEEPRAETPDAMEWIGRLVSVADDLQQERDGAFIPFTSKDLNELAQLLATQDAEIASLKAEIAEARGACPAVRMERFADASLLALVNEQVSQLFRCQAQVDRLQREQASSRTPEWPDPDDGWTPVYRVLVERDPDGKFWASWKTADGKEAGTGEPSASPIGSIAELCMTLINVEEDKRTHSAPPEGGTAPESQA